MSSADNMEVFEEAMALEGGLHELDIEDVTISNAAIGLIHRAASEIMNRHMPGSDPSGLTSAQAIAMFMDHVFWEERSGGLVLCMDVDAKSFCLPIPSEHWSVRKDAGLVQ